MKAALTTLALIFGLSGVAIAQTDIDCPQQIIDALEAQFPGEGRGTNADDCQSWKHGFGPGTTVLNRQRPANDPRCGFPTPPPPTQGQLIFMEPNDSVCDPFVEGRCPMMIGGSAAAGPANRSGGSSPDRINVGVFALFFSAIIGHEGTTGFRMDCGPGAPDNVDPSECGTGQTAIVFDDGFTTGDPGVDPKADLQFIQNAVEGAALCCDSPNDINCNAISNFQEYPNLNRPLPEVFPNRPGSPPIIFDGGRGTRWIHSQTWVNPGQLYGACLANPQVECNLTNLPASNPCPDFGDVCDLADRGLRLGLTDLLPDGSPNPGRCAHGRAVYQGNAVDPVTGRSTNCVIAASFPAGLEGDPQPGCLIGNFGVYNLPDNDCDGIHDDTDGDGQPGPDLCPSLIEAMPFADANDDGIGDECQCADGTGDGAVSSPDIAAVALCANGVVLCDSTLVDATGDGSTTAEDIAGVVAVVNGAQNTSDLLCPRNP